MPKLMPYADESRLDLPRGGDVRDPSDAVDNPATNGDDVFDPKPPRQSPAQDAPNENPPAPTSDDIRDREPPDRTFR